MLVMMRCYTCLCKCTGMTLRYVFTAFTQKAISRSLILYFLLRIINENFKVEFSLKNICDVKGTFNFFLITNFA